MPDLILHDIEPTLLDRIRQLADARGCGLEQALLLLLDRGLACSDDHRRGLDDLDARVLQEAIAALENVPSDPGFALIGRAVPAGAITRPGPNQVIAAPWASP